MSKEHFELISRYITAANEVIDIGGAESLEVLRVLLQAAHAEAAKGLGSLALQGRPEQSPAALAEGSGLV